MQIIKTYIKEVTPTDTKNYLSEIEFRNPGNKPYKLITLGEYGNIHSIEYNSYGHNKAYKLRITKKSFVDEIIEFDDFGREIKRSSNHNGKRFTESIFFYNKSGFIKKEIINKEKHINTYLYTYNSHGDILDLVLNIYNKTTHVLKTISLIKNYLSGDVDTHITEYSIRRKNRLEWFYFYEGKLDGVRIEKFTISGDIATRKSYDHNLKLFMSENFFYDDKNRLIKNCILETGGDIRYYSRFTYKYKARK
jgi:hypothetical protein